MFDFILRLKNGQTLRILPFDENNLYKEYYFYYIDDIGSFCLEPDTNIKFTSRIHRSLKYFYLVEYENKFHIIKAGRTLRNKIDLYFSDDSGQNFYDPKHLLECSIFLRPIITKVSSFDSYDQSFIIQMDGYENGYKKYDLFNTKEYIDIMSNFYDYIKHLKLDNSPTIIKKMAEKDYLLENHNYLLRNIKINDIRQNKVKSTKTKLWNQVIKMVGETSYKNERIEDIGFLEEDKSGEEVHQFMVDGYLFEVKLKDKV